MKELYSGFSDIAKEFWTQINNLPYTTQSEQEIHSKIYEAAETLQVAEWKVLKLLEEAQR